MNDEGRSIRQEDERIRTEAYEESKLSLGQAARATAVSAVIEGGMSFTMATAEKMREGKRLCGFTSEDCSDIAKASGSVAVKGGVRGVSIHMLANFTATPGVVASSICTASFSIAEQAHKFRNQKID